MSRPPAVHCANIGGVGRLLFLYIGFAVPVIGAVLIDRAARRARR
jgi:hypothetical protein